MQRFGGGINLNVHTHVLVIDGVFARDGVGVRFCPAPPLTDLDVAEVLATIVPRVRRLLERRGMGEGDEGAGVPEGWAEDAPVLAGIAAASVQGTFALGSRAGRPVRRCGAAPEQGEPPARVRGHARQEGFDLHAGVRVPADERDRLERLCRYALRPPVAQDRLHLTPEGQVVLQLRHPWSDGTTHLLFDPVELLERLAVLPVRLRSGHPERSRGVIPRPRINLIRYHGVLPFDVAQGTPSMVEGWGRERRGGRSSSASGTPPTRARPTPPTRHRPRRPRASPSPAHRPRRLNAVGDRLARRRHAGLTSCVAVSASIPWRVRGAVGVSD